VNAEQLRRCLVPHHIRDRPAPVAALRRELGVAEALHEHDPGASRHLKALLAGPAAEMLGRTVVAGHGRRSTRQLDDQQDRR